MAQGLSKKFNSPARVWVNAVKAHVLASAATLDFWSPVERVRLGLEHLHGIRVDEDASRGDANRLPFAIWYCLP